jgi:phospholipase/carboxylesterase
MSESIVIARPEARAEQLVMLFHGVGGAPQDMLPLGRRLAKEFSSAFIVSVCAPHGSDLGQGYQWFSVRGIDEDSRPQRVAEAMPAFVDTVRHWQAESGVGEAGTALVGFSQGGIMALESTRDRETMAGRVVSCAGRFAKLPQEANAGATLHMFHGKHDPVIPYAHTVTAAEHLVAIGADVTADVVPFVKHEINDDIASLLIERLRGHIPRRVWEEAMRAERARERDGQED